MNHKILILIILSLSVIGCSPRLKAREIFKDKKVRSLAVAAEAGNTNKIDRILAEGVDVNSVGDEGVTPLAWALLKMNKVGFEHLLKRGADPNARLDKRHTILFYAVQYDDSFYLETALKYGGDPNQRRYWLTETSSSGSVDTDISLLHYIICSPIPKPDIVRVLVKYGADVNEIDGNCGVVQSSAMIQDYENVYIFLEAGAPYSTNREPLSLLHCIEDRAVHPDDPEHEWLEKVVLWLDDRGIKVTPKEWKKKDQPKIINIVTEKPK